MRASTPRDASGFTLLEILVAVVLIGMVYTAAYQMFRGIQLASARVNGGQPRTRAAHVILDRIESELGGAILIAREEGTDPLLHPWVFYGESDGLDGNEADRVRFVTQTPLRGAGERRGRGLRLVSYGMESGPSGRGTLLRKEEALPDQLERDIDLADAQVVAQDVFSFGLNYGAEGSGEDRWDSTGVEHLDQTPENVEVSVQLWQRSESGDLEPGPVFTRSVALPVRPEYLQPRGGAQRTAACETGISTSECAEMWSPLFADYSPDAQEHYLGLFNAVSDACWEPEDPSAELRELHRQLKQLSKLDSTKIVAECEPRF